MLSSTVAAFNDTILAQNLTAVFSSLSKDARTCSGPTVTLEERQEPSCLQTVEVPVWYGLDYNTCTMQKTTAPCSVSFPSVSCHTSRPGKIGSSNEMSGTAKLWIVLGITIFLTIFIPIIVLWARWKLSGPRRGGKRSISVQLEKNEAKKPTSTAVSAPRRCGRRVLDRLFGRNRGKPAHGADTIRIVNNIHINARQPPRNSPPASAEQQPPQHPEEAPLMSPRVALESLRADHPLHLPQNRPWMHQDRDGRWVPEDEGYLHPGLPPPRRVRPGHSSWRSGG